MTMANPVEEFLLEKKSFNLGGMAQAARPYGKRVAEGVGMGALAGMGSAAFAGLSLGAAKLYDAATKTHDFNNMMEANPDLLEHHQQDPAGFNRMFSALRTMAPEMTKEPLVAGAFMRRGMEESVEARGFTAVDAAERGGRSLKRPGPLTEAALGGFSKGVGFDRKPVGQTKTVYDPKSGDNVSKVEDVTNRY